MSGTQETSNDNQTSIDAAILIPLLQGCIGGLFLGAAAGSVSWATGYGDPLPVLGAGCMLGTVAGWFSYRAGWERRLNRLLGVDDQPQVEAYPSEVYTPIEYQYNINYNEGRVQDRLFFGIPEDKFRVWCAGVAAGKSLSEDSWSGSAGIFSRSEYRSMRDELLRRGFIRPRGRFHNLGFVLTSKGEALTNGVALDNPANASPDEGWRLVKR